MRPVHALSYGIGLTLHRKPGDTGQTAPPARRRLARMCGRYAASRSTDELVEELEIEADHTAEPARSLLVAPQSPPPGAGDYNMAPRKLARVALLRRPRGPDGPIGDPVRQLRLMTWGLVPSWAKDHKSGARATNARAETVLDKPTFRAAARARRLLVPADGWYEWQASPTARDARGRPRKQPFFVSRSDGDVLTFAGLYEFWKDPSFAPDDPLAWLATFTLLTTAAEPGLDRIHDRQPLVLDRDDWAAWLDPELTDPAHVSALIAAPEHGRFQAWPVDHRVGSSSAQGPELLAPLARDALVGVVDPVTGEVIGG